MSFRLFTDGKNLGALNLYATTTHAFDNDDRLDGLAVAAQAAVALAATLEHDHLKHAIVTRQMIGEAIGILRGRYNLSSNQAFNVLRRLSSHGNVKLHILAQQVVDAGALPSTDEDV